MKTEHPFDTKVQRLRFGDFLLDLRRAELTKGGLPVPLRPKAFALLETLASQAGRAVSKEELLAAVWPGVVVTDDSLSQCVAEVRTALGDRGGQSIIRTLPRLGYRFDVQVDIESAPESAGDPAPHPGATLTQANGAAAPDVHAPARPSRWRRALPIGIGVAVTALALLVLWHDPPKRIDAELTARRSIAVMPFADLSAPPAPHVAEAVVDEIVTDVARMSDTHVMAAGTTRALAARGLIDPVAVGRQLGVQFVLSGSVQRAQK